MRDGCQIDAHPLGNLGVGLAGIGARAHEAGEIEGRQAVTLLVLGDLSVDVMGVRADDDRDGLEPCLPCGTKTLCAEEDVVTTGVGSRPYNDGLKDAALSDVVGKLGEFFVGEFGPWVGGVFLDAVDSHEERYAIGGKSVERECRRWGSGLFIDARLDRVGLRSFAWIGIRLVDEIELLYPSICSRACAWTHRAVAFRVLLDPSTSSDSPEQSPPRSQVFHFNPTRSLGLSQTVSTS